MCAPPFWLPYARVPFPTMPPAPPMAGEPMRSRLKRKAHELEAACVLVLEKPTCNEARRDLVQALQWDDEFHICACAPRSAARLTRCAPLQHSSPVGSNTTPEGRLDRPRQVAAGRGTLTPQYNIVRSGCSSVT